MEETNRFNNWYTGCSQILLPSKHWKFDNDIVYFFKTSKISGSIWTHSFGLEFNADNMDKDIYYKPKIIPILQNTQNITLQIVIKRFLSQSEETLQIRNAGPGFGAGFINTAKLSTFTFNITQPKTKKQGIEIWYFRKMTLDEARKMRLKYMPGINITWHYTGIVNNTEACNGNTLNNYFRRNCFMHFTLVELSCTRTRSPNFF